MYTSINPVLMLCPCKCVVFLINIIGILLLSLIPPTYGVNDMLLVSDALTQISLDISFHC